MASDSGSDDKPLARAREQLKLLSPTLYFRHSFYKTEKENQIQPINSFVLN